MQQMNLCPAMKRSDPPLRINMRIAKRLFPFTQKAEKMEMSQFKKIAKTRRSELLKHIRRVAPALFPLATDGTVLKHPFLHSISLNYNVWCELLTLTVVENFCSSPNPTFFASIVTIAAFCAHKVVISLRLRVPALQTLERDRIAEISFSHRGETVLELGEMLFKAKRAFSLMSKKRESDGKHDNDLFSLFLPESLFLFVNFFPAPCNRRLRLVVPQSAAIPPQDLCRLFPNLESLSIADTSTTREVDLSACTSLVHIGDEFCMCSLTVNSIILPSTVKEVGDSFLKCSTAVNEVDLSMCVALESIGDCFLENCQVTRCRLPQSVVHIGKGAFRSCAVVELDLSNCLKLTKIPDLFACGAGDLQRIKFPPHVIQIGAEVLSCVGDCFSFLSHPSSLPLLDLLYCNELRSIGESFCVSSHMLHSCVLPKSVQSIGANFLSDTPALRLLEIAVCEELEVLCDMFCSGTKSLESLSFPPSLVSIRHLCFAASGLKIVDLKNCDRLVAIGDNFCERSKVEHCLLPRGLRSIGKNFLASCPISLLDMSQCDSLTLIGENFGYNSRISEFTAPKSLEKIGQMFLCGCGDLTSVDLSTCSRLVLIEEGFCGQGTALAPEKCPNVTLPHDDRAKRVVMIRLFASQFMSFPDV